MTAKLQVDAESAYRNGMVRRGGRPVARAVRPGATLLNSLMQVLSVAVIKMNVSAITIAQVESGMLVGCVECVQIIEFSGSVAI